MRPIGPEQPADRALREWFDDQEKRNLDRIEAGAQTITQLVTGLYGVLFAVLALSDQPVYLQRSSIKWLGLCGVITFFGALLAALVTLYPLRASFQQDNLTEMQRVYDRIRRRKAFSLQISLGLFLLGIGLLAAVIVAVLWGW